MALCCSQQKEVAVYAHPYIKQCATPVPSPCLTINMTRHHPSALTSPVPSHRSVPAWLKDLPSLRTLDLSNNSAIKLDTITALTQLEVLVLQVRSQEGAGGRVNQEGA